MILYYFGAICPQDRYDRVNEGKRTVPAPAYKFNKILAEGFAALPQLHVKCLMQIPFHMDKKDEQQVYTENGVAYIQPGKKKNSRGIFQYFHYIQDALKCISADCKKDQVVLFCDALGISSSFVCLSAKRRYKIPAIAIMTDLPQYVGVKQRKKFFYRLKAGVRDRMTIRLANRFDYMVYLTKYMADVFRRKPFTVMEGVCEENGSAAQKRQTDAKDCRRICMYAGSLHKQYGIDVLVEAFVKAEIDHCELHIYGTGNYRDRIEEICREHENVKYCGMVSHDEILCRECEATLLVNPRMGNETYTLYSFPSKTLEYMASGTPLLMTKLPGLPENYYPYLYLFEEESVEGYAAALQRVFGCTDDELQEKGRLAQKFVLENKNGRVQAQRILEAFEMLPRQAGDWL